MLKSDPEERSIANITVKLENNAAERSQRKKKLYEAAGFLCMDTSA